MNIIWANRLIAGTKTWAEMPASRRAGVKKVLAERINKGEITAEDYKFQSTPSARRATGR